MALNVAAVAVSAGVDVHVFLAQGGVELALPDLGSLDGFAVDHAPPIVDLVASVLALGRVTVCTPCATRRGLGVEELVDGVAMGGSAQFVERALRPDVTALVY